MKTIDKACFILLSLTLLFCTCVHQHIWVMDSNRTLYPYLGTNELYGYADFDGNVVIEPQYKHADFFINGKAVIQTTDGQRKLIDSDNQEIHIPIKYDEVKIHTLGNQTILELVKTYSSRLRFWEWKFLPDFSFMGSSTRNRLIDTHVLREKRSLYWLEGKRKISSKTISKPKGNSYFHIKIIDEYTIQIDDRIYISDNTTIRPIIKNLISTDKLYGGYFLQKKGNYSQIIDTNGNRITDKEFKSYHQFELEVAGHYLALKVQSMSPYHRSANLYVDDKMNAYVYPDMVKKFPKKINEYPFQDTISAIKILKSTQVFESIPDSDQFLLMRNFGKEVYALDTLGNWRDPEESMGKISVTTRSGAILWPKHSAVLTTISLPKGWEVSAYYDIDENPRWYRVKIQKDKIARYGIWDIHSESWIMPPEFYWVGYDILEGNFVAFQKEENGKWGFYDLENQQLHIPPIYDYCINSWVNIYDREKGNPFFLDIKNKKEFREKLD